MFNERGFVLDVEDNVVIGEHRRFDDRVPISDLDWCHRPALDFVNFHTPPEFVASLILRRFGQI
jgi:hypothetical protein